jgi:excisionase family DNA binding protein
MANCEVTTSGAGRWMSIKDLAEYTRHGRRTLERLIRAKVFRVRRLPGGAKRLFDRDEVDRILAAGDHR